MWVVGGGIGRRYWIVCLKKFTLSRLVAESTSKRYKPAMQGDYTSKKIVRLKLVVSTGLPLVKSLPYNPLLRENNNLIMKTIIKKIYQIVCNHDFILQDLKFTSDGKIHCKATCKLCDKITKSVSLKINKYKRNDGGVFVNEFKRRFSVKDFILKIND
jgi:hypothetical protein